MNATQKVCREDKILKFEERTNLPGRASKSKLEEVGARCLSTIPVLIQERRCKMEYMVKEDNENTYIWKRITPLEEDFTIHEEVYGIKHQNQTANSTN